MESENSNKQSQDIENDATQNVRMNDLSDNKLVVTSDQEMTDAANSTSNATKKRHSFQWKKILKFLGVFFIFSFKIVWWLAKLVVVFIFIFLAVFVSLGNLGAPGMRAKASDESDWEYSRYKEQYYQERKKNAATYSAWSSKLFNKAWRIFKSLWKFGS